MGQTILGMANLGMMLQNGRRDEGRSSVGFVASVFSDLLAILGPGLAGHSFTWRGEGSDFHSFERPWRGLWTRKLDRRCTDGRAESVSKLGFPSSSLSGLILVVWKTFSDKV